MSASYPGSLKTFSSVVDGVTKLVAALFNSPYDEITAIETMIGVMGRNQGYSDSFKNLLTNYAYGCQCVYNSTTALFVNPGQIVLNDGSGNYSFRNNPSQISVDFTMLDTGVKTNSTQYFIYATADVSATTFLCKLSLSSTAPSGTTFSRKIGQCFTDSSGNLNAGSVNSLLTVGLGTWTSISIGTVYQAATDGEVNCVAYTFGSVLVESHGYTDSSSSPATEHGTILHQGSGGGDEGGGSFSFSVRKGDYYKVTTGGTAFFISKGV